MRFKISFVFLLAGCKDESEEQVFQNEKMVGCDGSFTRSTFRSACSEGWHVATASDYHQYGGKTVRPNKKRWIDVAWDSSGRETSLDNYLGYYNRHCASNWHGVRHTSNCFWVSCTERCGLAFSNMSYGSSRGGHCNRENEAKGVVCVKD